MEMKALQVMCPPSKGILIVFAVRGSYLSTVLSTLVGPLALTKNSFSAIDI